MYQISKGSTAIGVTEHLVFTRRAENGCFVQCPREVAQGFVHQGTVYSLGGENGYQDAPVAAVVEFDGGAAITDLQGAVDNLVVSALMGGASHV
ncbi:MAG: hypothetical protein RSB55_03750 [Oscillospiraceae bacterium]